MNFLFGKNVLKKEGIDLIKINSTRLEDIIENTSLCLNELKRDIGIFKTIDETNKFYRITEKAIRQDIADLFKNIEDYLAFTLKTVGVGISKKSLREALDSAKEKKLMSEEFAEFIKNSMKIRNYFSHRYNYPTTEYLIEFYIENETVFDRYLEFINERLENTKSENNLIDWL